MRLANWREVVIGCCCTCILCISNQAMSYAACELNRYSSRILLYMHLGYQLRSHELCGLRIEETAVASCCRRILCISNQAMSYAAYELNRYSCRILLYMHLGYQLRSRKLCGLRIKEAAVASCCTCILYISNQAMSYAACELKRDSSRILLYMHVVYQQSSHELCGLRIE